MLLAAEELGYSPNLVARGLTSRRSYAIGLLVPDLSNPFYADVIAGAERVASAEGYALLLSEARGADVRSRVEALQARQIDGILMDAVGANTLGDHVLATLNVMLIDESSDRWPAVASDAFGAGRIAGEHLLDMGHTRVAFIGPAANVSAVRLRERGFVSALRARGVGITSELLRRSPATASGGREAMRRMLQLSQRPTAVFCGNDVIALGALKACADAGVSVPAALSVVGCDDIELARLVTPELTTVAVPARELGARAMRQLIRRLEGAPAAASGRPLPVRLMPRASSGVAPALSA